MSVDLTGPGEDDLHGGIVLPASFEQRELTPAIDFEIGVGVVHAVDMADLAGQVEDHVLPADEVTASSLRP